MDNLTVGLPAAQSAVPIIALAVALVGAVAAALLFLGPKGRENRQGFLGKLSAHVNFDRFLIASILKFLYVFLVLYSVVYGLAMLFSGAPLTGLIWLALGPVGLRVVFEQLLLLLSVKEQLGETNDLLRRMQGLPPKNAPQPQPQPSPRTQPPQRTQAAPPQAARQPVENRYPPRPTAYPAQNGGFNGYTAQPRTQTPANAYPTDYGMTQRYAPVRREGYGNGYDAPAYGAASGTAQSANAAPVVRPTPADGTGRFSALPRLDDREPRKK